jgi:hypothetical protein
MIYFVHEYVFRYIMLQGTWCKFIDIIEFLFFIWIRKMIFKVEMGKIEYGNIESTYTQRILDTFCVSYSFTQDLCLIYLTQILCEWKSTQICVDITQVCVKSKQSSVKFMQFCVRVLKNKSHTGICVEINNLNWTELN